MTEIEPGRCNLKERDIEDYLWENPTEVTTGYDGHCVSHWIARQLQVPSGIIDLLGISTDGDPVVVEVKNVSIDSRAIAQVSRYAKDIEMVLSKVGNYMWPTRIVVGPDIDDIALFEANALEVRYLKFSVNLSLEINGVNWSDAYRAKIDSAYTALAESNLFVEFETDEPETNQQVMADESSPPSSE